LRGRLRISSEAVELPLTKSIWRAIDGLFYLGILTAKSLDRSDLDRGKEGRSLARIALSGIFSGERTSDRSSTIVF
jgi:hypothetical protein